MKKITLSGLAGSGKTTIGKLLAKKLSFEFISLGNFARKIAKNEFNMNINEFQNYCYDHPEIDNEIDNKFKDYCNKTNNLIVDYRLGFYFIKNSLNVFLDVPENEAVNRLLKANRTSEFKKQTKDNIRKMMNKRNIQMKDRFIRIYNLDFTDKSNYDIVINTIKYFDINEIVNIIIKNFKN